MNNALRDGGYAWHTSLACLSFINEGDSALHIIVPEADKTVLCCL